MEIPQGVHVVMFTGETTQNIKLPVTAVTGMKALKSYMFLK